MGRWRYTSVSISEEALHQSLQLLLPEDNAIQADEASDAGYWQGLLDVFKLACKQSAPVNLADEKNSWNR
jgi:hypothetical protein